MAGAKRLKPKGKMMRKLDRWMDAPDRVGGAVAEGIMGMFSKPKSRNPGAKRVKPRTRR